MPWFSASVRLAVLIKGLGLDTFTQSVVVFRAADRDAAFARALALGRALETTYANGDGEEVRWRLAEIVTLDQLKRDDLDGAEVYFTFEDEPTERLPFETVFHPADSEPRETGTEG